MDSLYDVCFAGEILEGQDLATVRDKLAKLFKANEATLDKLFSGKTQVLKRDCNRETALKYQKAIKLAGAKPIIRARPEAEVEAPARLDEETPPPQESDGGVDLAPTGSDVLRPEERPSEVSQDIDTSGIDLMDTGSDLSDGGDEPPPAPDTSHLTMGEVGDDIPTLASTAELLSPDISGIALSPEDTDFSDCAAPPPVAPDVDLSALDLAPSGADMLEEDYRPNRDAEAPATDHIELEDD